MLYTIAMNKIQSQNCTNCAHLRYTSYNSPTALCFQHAPEGVVILRGKKNLHFPIVLNEVYPDYVFRIPEFCDKYQPSNLSPSECLDKS